METVIWSGNNSMKIKYHIDVYQFEFVELELEADNYEQLAREIRKAHIAFHKVCEKEEVISQGKQALTKLNSDRSDKIAKSKLDFVEDLDQ